jgi:hypothetical protein
VMKCEKAEQPFASAFRRADTGRVAYDKGERTAESPEGQRPTIEARGD